MLANRGKFLAVEVDERAAALAFAMEAGVDALARRLRDIFEAGGAVRVDEIFVDDALGDEVFQLPVHGRLPDRHALLPAVGAHIRGGHMPAGKTREICNQDIALPCLVFVSRIHEVSSCRNCGAAAPERAAAKWESFSIIAASGRSVKMKSGIDFDFAGCMLTKMSPRRGKL